MYSAKKKNIHRSDVFATLLLVKSYLTFAVEFITLRLSLLAHFCRCARLENETEIKTEKTKKYEKQECLYVLRCTAALRPLRRLRRFFGIFFPFIDNRSVDLGEKKKSNSAVSVYGKLSGYGGSTGGRRPSVRETLNSR